MPTRKDNRKGRLAADVVILGGGLAGACLSALLSNRGINVICIDHEDPAKTLEGSFDGRTTAISFGSQKIMERAGVWEGLSQEASPIRTIDILEQGASYLRFDAAEVAQDAFGWIVENRILRAALYKIMAAQKTCRHLAPAQVDKVSFEKDCVIVTLRDGRDIVAPLIVGADGKNSFLREHAGIGTRGHSYRQQAYVCVVRHEHPHHGNAVEDFRSEGPFAILPMTDDKKGGHRSSVVWTQEARSQSISVKDSDYFVTALSEHFPSSYGRISLGGPIFTYPLSLTHAYRYTAPRLALIADAAHAIHPIAGQGLNLGLRDVEILSAMIIAGLADREDIGAEKFLSAYETRRRPDNMAMAGATDILNRLFSNRVSVVGMARRAGLKIVAKTPRAKKFFVRYAMGISPLGSSKI